MSKLINFYNEHKNEIYGNVWNFILSIIRQNMDNMYNIVRLTHDISKIDYDLLYSEKNSGSADMIKVFRGDDSVDFHRYKLDRNSSHKIYDFLISAGESSVPFLFKFISTHRGVLDTYTVLSRAIYKWGLNKAYFSDMLNVICVEVCKMEAGRHYINMKSDILIPYGYERFTTSTPDSLKHQTKEQIAHRKNDVIKILSSYIITELVNIICDYDYSPGHLPDDNLYSYVPKFNKYALPNKLFLFVEDTVEYKITDDMRFIKNCYYDDYKRTKKEHNVKIIFAKDLELKFNPNHKFKCEII